MIDIQKIREEFPILNQKVNGYPLVYFDNAATTHKPLQVIEKINQYYLHINSNIHRGVHHLSQEATAAYEETRNYIRTFINAESSEQIIFTKGTTEAINLVASGFAHGILQENDSIVVSVAEHHSNFVPWQQACKQCKASFHVFNLHPDGKLNLTELESLLEKKPKILAIAHVSNVLGIVNPIKEIINIAHSHGVPVLIDGAQGIAHTSIDVQDLDCDFYCCSAHKAYGPMGIGFLYGKKEWLEKLHPYQYGGEMIEDVSVEDTSFTVLPFKFEAGTPQVAEAIAFKSALEFINRIGYENIIQHEKELCGYAMDRMSHIEGLTIYGTAFPKAGVISFNIDGVYHYDAGTILDQMGIAVRTGHHCAQPLMKYLNIPGTIRCSFSIYNTTEEVDRFIEALQTAIKMLR